MDAFAEAAGGKYSETQAIDAYCFGPEEFFVAIQAEDEEEEIFGSILLRVPMDSPTSFEILDSFDRATLNYWAPDSAVHFVHASGRQVRRVSRGRASIHHFDQYDTSLMQMAGTSDGTVVVYGDGGVALKLSEGSFLPVETGLEEDLYAMHVNSDGLVAIGGDFGDFAMGTLDALAPTDTGVGRRIILLHARDDGSIAIVPKRDAAREFRDSELIAYDEHEAPWYSIANFQGHEFWGDDDWGVFLRRGSEFIPVFETEYAFTMHATASHLIVNSAHSIRIWDGDRWRNFAIRGNPDTPVVETDLDFEPNWPV